MPYVLRRKIDEELEKWANGPADKCLLIKGARQVGKSFSVEKFLSNHFNNHVTINFDIEPSLKEIFKGKTDIDSILDKINIHFKTHIGSDSAIFIDEIQSCPEARTLLKTFALDGRVHVVASGSLLGLTFRNCPSFPVGYEHVVDMKSLDFEEFLWARGINEETISYIRECILSKEKIDEFILNSIEENFRIFCVVGGMPRAVVSYLETNNIEKVRQEQNDIMSGYRNDIGKYSEMKDRDRIFNTLDSIPIQLSRKKKKFMYSAIPDVSNASNRTYAYSIEWLINSGIVSQCNNISEPKLPIEERVIPNSFKIYMNDTGLLLSMMDYDVSHGILVKDTRVNKGGITENLTAECLIKSGKKLNYFERNNLELDFILVIKGIVTAAEVKSGNSKQAKSLRSAKENYNVKRRIKFENTNIYVDTEGVEHYPLFVSAFSDSLSETLDAIFIPPDTDEINDRMKALKKT